MKRFIYATMCIVSLCLGGCEYDDAEVWDAINDQEERIAALEEWQKTVNENIAALQAIVNGNDYITSVEEIKEGDEVIGYTINFYRQGEVTIYNGKDGEDGEVPVIGVTEGEDGRWYWTVNGELMEDADGNPVCASGKDGEDGEDGEDGQDGSSYTGVTPVIKLGVELGPDYNQYASYLSVDGGKTWTQMNVTLDWYGSSLESVEDCGAYYKFKFSETSWGYIPILCVPSYTGGLQFYLHADYLDYDYYISNGEYYVKANKPFSIIVNKIEGYGRWTCEPETKLTNDWSYKRNGNTLEFDNAPKAGEDFTLKFAYVDSENRVTNYQITLISSDMGKIESETNPQLVDALAKSLGDYILNEDGDVEITPAVIQNAIYLDISDQEIESLAGIEAFVNLEYLNCSGNPLTSLDVSAFSELRELYCNNCFNQSPQSRSYENGVLDLSANMKLQILSCTDNGLTELILPDTQTLSLIYCSNNQLTHLDVSKITSLNYLYCYGNRLTQLDISNNILLQNIVCGPQYTSDNSDQQLILTINESQQALWESSWKGNNYNVILADGLVHSSGGSGSNFGNGGVY